MRVRPLVLAVAASLLAPVGAGAAEVRTFPVPTAKAGLFDIAAGPDGNLWFTEQAGGQIGRITPAGQITEYPGQPDSSLDDYGPTNLVAGSEGALWFLTGFRSHLGRVVPGETPKLVYDADGYGMENLGPAAGGGVWMSFDHGSGPDTPDDDDGLFRVRPDLSVTRVSADYLGNATPITAAGEGAAWFGDGGKAIKRVTEASQTQVFPVTGLDAVDEVTDIAVSSTGTTWFVGFNPKTGWFSSDQGGAIGRIQGGEAVAMPLRDQAVPKSLIPGPDGSVWFAGKAGITRVDASGTMQTTPIRADAIAFGPDGGLWFVDEEANTIGRATVDGSLFPTLKGARPVFRALGTVRGARKAKRLDVRCTLLDAGSCAVTATVSKAVARKLRLGKTRTLGKGIATGTAAGEIRVPVKLGTKARKALGRAGRRTKVTLAVTVRGPQTVATAKKTVTLKR